MVELLIMTVILGLGSWRIASVLATEDAGEWVRVRIGIGHDEQGDPVIYPDTFWGKVFGCFWCLSSLVALVVTLLHAWGWTHYVRAYPRYELQLFAWWQYLLLWLASSAAAIWFEKQVMRSRAR